MKDTWSSASRQHYVDTGEYLDVEEGAGKATYAVTKTETRQYVWQVEASSPEEAREMAHEMDYDNAAESLQTFDIDVVEEAGQ